VGVGPKWGMKSKIS